MRSATAELLQLRVGEGEGDLGDLGRLVEGERAVGQLLVDATHLPHGTASGVRGVRGVRGVTVSYTHLRAHETLMNL
eukprot:6205223-Prymnesium_polylepis.1